MSKLDYLIPILADSPRVLLLGQSSLGRNDSTSPLTKGIYFGNGSFLEECISDDWKSKQDLLDAASNAVPIEDVFALVQQFPWRCIFTSSIDAIPFRLFNSGTRPVQSIFDARKAHSNNLVLQVEVLLPSSHQPIKRNSETDGQVLVKYCWRFRGQLDQMGSYISTVGILVRIGCALAISLPASTN